MITALEEERNAQTDFIKAVKQQVCEAESEKDRMEKALLEKDRKIKEMEKSFNKTLRKKYNKLLGNTLQQWKALMKRPFPRPSIGKLHEKRN